MPEHQGRDVDELLALEIARGTTIKAAAEAVGISERTATRRCADADFREMVHAFRRQMIDRALGILSDTLTEAAQTLRDLMNDEDPRVALRAAQAVFEKFAVAKEALDVEERIEELRQLVEGFHGKETRQ